MDGLRPLGVGELIDASIKIYLGRWKTLLAAVAVPVVPVVILSALVTWSAQPDTSVDPLTGATQFDGGDLALTIAATLVSSFALIVATTVATAACFRSISGAYLGDEADWRESLRFALGRFGSVLGLTLLTTLATLLGLLACIVGIVVPMAFYAVAMPALLVEGIGATDAMGRSWRLVKGTFWRVLGIVLLGTLLASIFQGILSAPLVALIVTDVSPVLEQVVNVLVQSVATVLVTPFTAALTMALYVDLRVRKEGFDLVLWAQRLGADPTGGFPAQPGAPAYPPAGYGYPPPPGYPPYGGPPPPGYPPAPGSPPPPPPPPPAGTGWGPPPSTGWGPPPGQEPPA